ncbi:MAG: helix-turn-helix transcriptional regulator [Coriobacteriales bacterium]|jgi:DNA-binding CsgD family transcriptional regulator|nr:helix-turn-helix transcriptional regulator [Coriobacteriales bacterium]
MQLGADAPKIKINAYHILVATSFACYWLWTFCVLIAKFIPQRISTSAFEDSWFWSTLGHIMGLLLVAALARSYAPFGDKKVVVIGSPCICLLGYTFLLYSSMIGEGAVGCLLLGSLLTGLGNAGLLVCWCESYTAGYSGGMSRFTIAVATLLAMAIIILISFLPSSIQQIVLAVTPFLTMTITRLSLRTSPHRRIYTEVRRSSDYSPYFAVFCLTYTLPLGFFQMHFTSGIELSDPYWLQLLAPSLLFVIAFVIVDAMLTRLFKTSILVKIIVPATIAGLLLLSLFDANTLPGGTLIYSSQQFMAIFFYSLFAALAAREQTAAAHIFAIGVVFMDTGYVAGQLLGEIARGLLYGHVLEITLGIVYVVALVGVFVLPRVSEALTNKRQTQTLRASFDTTQQVDKDVLFAIEQIAKQHQLTAREKEMLGFLVRGKSVPAIARETFLSQNTVKTHVSHIYLKLAIHSRDELIGYIEQIGKSPPSIT